MPRTALALSIYVALAVLAGCGSSESNFETTPARTTPSQTQTAPPDRAAEERYRSRADAICREVDRRVGAIPRPEDPARQAGYLRRVVAIGRVYLRRLAALDPPPRLAATAHTAVALARREIELLEEAAEALARSSDPAATLRAYERRIDALLDREDALWQDLGITACADEPRGGAGVPI
jgi:hypothetical protein